jgi:hypothetical protein
MCGFTTIEIITVEFNHLTYEVEVGLNIIYEFSPYRKENTALHRYKDQPVNGCLRR